MDASTDPVVKTIGGILAGGRPAARAWLELDRLVMEDMQDVAAGRKGGAA